MFFVERHGKQFLKRYMVNRGVKLTWISPGKASGCLIPTQFYAYIDNTERENDFFSTQSFPVTLSGDFIL